MKLSSQFKLLGVLLVPQLVTAGPIHPHCDVKPWIDNPVLQITPALPVVNPINVIAIPSFVQGAPTSAVPNCFYELSDITSIEVTLRTGAPGGQIEFLFVPPQLPLAGAGPWNFIDGNSLLFEFPRHATSAAGDIHVRFPNDPADLNTRIEIQLRAGLSEPGTTLTGMTMEFRGDHYFLPQIPEPSTFPLMAIGMVSLLGYARRFGRGGWGKPAGGSPNPMLL